MEPINGSLGESKDWELGFTVATGVTNWTQIAPTAAATDGYLIVPIQPYFNCTFDRVQVQLDGPAHGGAWPPANMPSVAVWNTAGIVIGTTVDPNNQVNYELPHVLTIGPFAPVTFNSYDQFVLVIHGETGAQAVVGLTALYASMRIVPA
jgi:hypothetical protein